MAGIISISRTNLEGRRQKLRKKRQMRIIQSVWRTFAITGLAGGLLWTAIQPTWVLRDPKDIVIAGNQLLSKEAIQSTLEISYPQSLWRIEPFRIAESLKKQPTIAQATVSRRLFPPGLIIHVKEREPVAIAEQRLAPNLSKNSKDGVRSALVPGNTDNKKVSVGLLDASGVWMPLEKQRLRNPTIELPSLKVIGLPEQYRPYWIQLYQALSQSSVKVMEIDWQDPTNLILKTELGKVYLGTPSFHLPEQIRVMAQMRRLPPQLNLSQIEYIDLKNPQFPLVQMLKKRQPLHPPNS